MQLKIGDPAPDFDTITPEGKRRFHDWVGTDWAVLFWFGSRPSLWGTMGPEAIDNPDYAFASKIPVVTLNADHLEGVADIEKRTTEALKQRRVKIVGLSYDEPGFLAKLAGTGAAAIGPNFLTMSDANLKIAKLYGLAPPWSLFFEPPLGGKPPPNLLVIGPDKKIMLMLYYPMHKVRSFDTVLRLIDSLQHPTVEWKQGEDVVLPGSVADVNYRVLPIDVYASAGVPADLASVLMKHRYRA
jgi:alkyl hydroperoxide reductase subunit AhpC